MSSTIFHLCDLGIRMVVGTLLRSLSIQFRSLASAYPVVSADPNRLRSHLGKIGCAACLLVRCWLAAASQTEQGLKCSHRLLATVVPKHKFVEINRELSA